jgi:hypothetical protein
MGLLFAIALLFILYDQCLNITITVTHKNHVLEKIVLPQLYAFLSVIFKNSKIHLCMIVHVLNEKYLR